MSQPLAMVTPTSKVVGGLACVALTLDAWGCLTLLGLAVGGIVASNSTRVACLFRVDTAVALLIVALRGLVAYVPTLETLHWTPTATLPTSASVAMLVVVGWRVVPHSTELRVIKQENVPGKSSIHL